MDKKTVNVNINGTDYTVEAGRNVLETCRSLGIEIPFFCYHPNLKVAGSCRMCLVYTGMPARDRATGELIKNPGRLAENSVGAQAVDFLRNERRRGHGTSSPTATP